jgi:hypothetical protein
MNYPALVFLALIAWSITARPATLLILLLASMPFASLALLPTELVGGMSILPQSMFAAVLIGKVLAPQVMPLSSKLVAALQLRNLGFLFLFLLTGTAAAVLMPRLFLGDVVIVPMRELTGAEPLTPTQANFTQFGYVTLSVAVAFAVMLMTDKAGFARALLSGVLAGGAMCVLTGLVDVAAASTGTEYLLAPFRNAEYAYLTEDAVGGMRRVVGLTPEASGYGSLCVQFATPITLFRHLYEGRYRNLATIVAAGLIALALLSTSSTAYGGLAVLALVYAANGMRRLVVPSPLGQRGLVWELLVGWGVVVALLVVLVIRPNLFDPLLNLIQEVIFNKPQTSSYYGRSEWNTIAWNTVASTWGLGVGFGSTRASNWFAAVASNTGLIGATFMGIFLIQTFARRLVWRTSLSAELLPALKLSLLPALTMAGVAAPGPDFGPWVGVIFGAVAGIAALRPELGSASRVDAGRPLRTRVVAPRPIVSRTGRWSIPPQPRGGDEPESPTARPSF